MKASADRSGPVQILDPLGDEQWDDRIARRGVDTFFWTRAWTRVLKNSYGFSPCYLGIDPDAVEATIVPLMEVNSPLTGRRGVGLPFSDQCAPIVGAGHREGWFDEVLALGRRRGWKYVELRGGLNWIPSAVSSAAYWGHDLSLDAGSDRLFEGFSSATRRSIRKAQAHGVVVELGSSIEQMREFFRLQVLTRKRQGLPPQPWTFFAELTQQVMGTGQGVIALARSQGRAVAGAVFCQFNRRVLYKFAASDRADQHLRANDLVLWEALKWFCRNGFSSFDFGRTGLDQAGLRRFKLGFGARERQIDYIRFDFRQNRFVKASEAGGAMASRVFRLLPQILLRMVGRVLYRHVA